MLTIFAVPKPFSGRFRDVQMNAIQSWAALRDDVQVVLVGDEEGVEQAARASGVEHVGGLVRNVRGTPRLDSAFERAATVARWPLWCFVNADILLLDDFLPAIKRAETAFSDFLLIGECRDLDVAAGTPLKDPAARLQLHKTALDRGRLRGYAAIDYFVFRQGLFDPVPPFLIGRVCFDNWLVWRARELSVPVIDATRSVVAVHQSHDYSHVGGGFEATRSGGEARYNEQLAGGREHIYSLHDATHRLYSRGRPIRYLGSTLRARERARSAKAKLDFRMAQRRARNGFQRPVRLLGVYGRPSTETTPLLNALAGGGDVDLNVLYAMRARPWALTSRQGPQHVHWFPRSVRFTQIDRALGREYPINWAIWKSFHSLRPDCMIIAGWGTFATQAAITWCLARRVPFLLLLDENDRAPADRARWRHVLIDAVARRAAAVLVPGRATTKSMLADDVETDGEGTLPEATHLAAARVRDLARGAWIDDSTRRSLAASVLFRRGRPLRHALTRRARTRRTHSAHAGQRG